MKKYFFSAVLAIAFCGMLGGCNKEDLLLSGSASEADFNFVQPQAPDTLPYETSVSFINNSKEAILYQWNFGDNSALSPEKDPTHVFKTGGTYNVTLTTVGTNGNNSITKVLAVSDACQDDVFNKLTNCAMGEWTWSTGADAIKVLSPDGLQVYFAGPAAGCQADDVFKFSKDGSFVYEANGQTFDAQAGFSCQAPKANAQKFKLVVKAGQLPKIILAPLAGGTGSPFIGTTDVVEGNSYTIQNYTENTLTLRAKDPSNGNLIEISLKKLVVLGINDILNLLTGGSSKRWKLDPDPAAKAIIVGTENNPAEYFGGGTLEACQTDDIYTFFSNNTLNYNAAGATFNGGNIAPNYNCGADRSYNIPYSFGATTGGVAGLGTILLPGAGAPPARFIGVTDVPENVYRIIEISPTRMLLRAGSGSGTIFQFKFIAL
jgi:PKD repeat protein